MNSFAKYILLFFFLSFQQCTHAKEAKWSASLGKLNWEEAKSKCAKEGKRLPTLDELKTSFEKQELESWKKDGNTYWTSDEISSDRAFYFTLLNGVKFSLAKDKKVLVRCVL
ncbi:MAG: hypothetical protein IPQ05_03265 [Leptospiraceae bacterium]|nr:hypothetical protein [Leptospiraceae bacterium]